MKRNKIRYRKKVRSQEEEQNKVQEKGEEP